MKQIVVIKGQKDGIGVYLDEKADFWLVQVELRRKVSQSRGFFEGASPSVFFYGRVLNKQEELSLINIIKSETNMNASFLVPISMSSEEPTNQILRPQKQSHEPVNEPIQNNPDPQPETVCADKDTIIPTNETRTDKEGRTFLESQTAYYHTNLRSGQSISYPGSVVVMGDVNPGSEVVAGGNVTILGSLKGMAHAGADGDDTCMVTALVLEPTQIRIGKTISYVKPKEKGKDKQVPSCAYARDGVVYIAVI